MKEHSRDIETVLNQWPEERRVPMRKLIEVTSSNLPDGFEMAAFEKGIHYLVPKSIYPSGYHADPQKPLPFITYLSQSKYIGVYHMGLYAFPELAEWFRKAYSEHAKYKLDMGKSCIRLKRMDDIPFSVFEELFTKITPQQWIEKYEASIKR